MEYKWIGAVLIVLGCGGTGCYLGALHRKTAGQLAQLSRCLRYLASQLEFRLTTLQEVSLQLSHRERGPVSRAFREFAGELISCRPEDPALAMTRALDKTTGLTWQAREQLLKLGRELGCYDLGGQIEALRALQEGCRDRLQSLRQDQHQRLRSYRVLGLCTGAALVILLA